MDFEIAIDTILDSEGGYVNDPVDPGGETKYGISKKQYPSLDIMMLTEEKAKKIYKQDYWDKCTCDRLPEKIRLVVFDGAVNHGVPNMAKMLQRLIGVTADGLIGPMTQAASHSKNQDELLISLLAERSLFYHRIPTFSRYGKGWMKRLFKVSLES